MFFKTFEKVLVIKGRRYQSVYRIEKKKEEINMFCFFVYLFGKFGNDPGDKKRLDM